MKTKKKALYISIAVVALVLLFAISVCAVRRTRNDMDIPYLDEEEAIAYLEEVISYLEQQKDTEDTEKSNLSVTAVDERYPHKHIRDGRAIDLIISCLANSTKVRRVRDIPGLTAPIVYVGKDMAGNNEKLYYFKGNELLEFTLNEHDSFAFLLYITQYDTLYPDVREAFAEGVIRQLQDEIDFGDQDVLKLYENGYLESIDIKTPETAEVLFKCIRECTHISDLTGWYIEAEPLPIMINGQWNGNFTHIYVDYKVTERFYRIGFSEENEEYFYNYVMGLKEK